MMQKNSSVFFLKINGLLQFFLRFNIYYSYSITKIPFIFISWYRIQIALSSMILFLSQESELFENGKNISWKQKKKLGKFLLKLLFLNWNCCLRTAFCKFFHFVVVFFDEFWYWRSTSQEIIV